MQHSSPKQRGSIVVTILFIMMFLTTLLFGLVILAKANLFRAYQRVYLLQAQYSAESGADAALATINGGNSSYTGTTSDVTILTTTQYKATFSTTVAAGSSGSQKIITSTGKVYKPATASTPTYTRKVRVTISLTSASSATSLMARNIISVDSSVKNVQAKNIYVNGYINLTSNATTMEAESITVAGKDTGASNCSIEGSGSLAKASSLGAGAKATIDLRYNNCINPPGNISNSNFNVTVNDPNVAQLTSTYIPWSSYMDSTYQNSPSGCSDWTAAGSTLAIPSTGNTKKTHYPDSSSGIATSCGTNGDLSLGTKLINITDNAHIRANFCKSTACDPIFNNTSGSLKFVFVEGTMNFSSVRTCSNMASTPSAIVSACGGATSAPIAFITYGADPGTHNKCPYGDSIFINKDGATGTSAPAAYFLATNSVCLYQTKFDSTPAIGGIGGKNLYVSSNSGNPFDLYLDPDFPVSSIPVNLSWRAVGYERL